ncbi:MAG TPA: hypothetical protein VME21_10260 [Steroidobacteraceae bacterium]|nr:hypothetical protein [Steroidobacteraceae bacterium]
MSTNISTARRRAHLSCAAIALGLNALFAWGAIQATSTVPPLRAWQVPAPVAQAADAADAATPMQTIRVAGLAAARVAGAALVQ